MSTETKCSYCGESMYSDLQFTILDALQTAVAQTHTYCSSMWLDECQDPDLKNGYPVSELTQLPSGCYAHAVQPGSGSNQRNVVDSNTAVYLVNAPKPGNGSPTVIACCAEHRAEALKWAKSKSFGCTSKVYTYDQALASLQERAKELRAQFSPVDLSGPAGGGSVTRQAVTGNYFDQYGPPGQAMQDDFGTSDARDDAADETNVALDTLAFTTAATPHQHRGEEYDAYDFDRDVFEPPKRSRRVAEMVGMSDIEQPSTSKGPSSKSKSSDPFRMAQAFVGFRRKIKSPSKTAAAPRTGDNKAERVLGERSLPLSTSVANLTMGATPLSGDDYQSEERDRDAYVETGTGTRSFV